MKNKTIALGAILSALAIALGYVESLLPLPIPLPGVKLGLSNIVVLFTVYAATPQIALAVMLIKVLTMSAAFTGMAAFLYALFGGIASLAAMLFGKKLRMNIISCSVIGAVFHNLGQLVAASLFMKEARLIYYLPFLIFAGVATGLLIGFLGKLLTDRFSRFTNPKK